MHKKKRAITKHKAHGKIKLPLSMKIFVSYLSLLGFFYFLFFLFPTTVLFGLVIEDLAARILNICFVVVIGSIVYGIMKTRLWAFYLALFWMGFEIFNSLFSMFLVRKEELIAGFMTAASIYVTLINIIIIWFIYTKKGFFTHKKYSVGVEDKVFMFSIVILVVLMFILVTSSATRIYIDTTYISSGVIEELNYKNIDQALFVCNSKFGQEKDVCYIVVAVAYEDAPIEICNHVQFSFYKATCVRAAKA